MLTFVGLGLYDERSITVRGRAAVAAADRAFAEFYTSVLAGATVADLEAAHGVDIAVRDRAGVEQDPGPILDAAAEGEAVFLTGGDPMVSTTHVDLRLRAHDRGIDTRVIHGTSAGTAAASLTGLQNYRFGKATTLPFPRRGGGVPDSVLDTIRDNRDRDLHTLVYLDIDREGGHGLGFDREGGHDPDDSGDRDAGAGRFMTGSEAAGLLADAGLSGIGVVVARAGSDDPTVRADRVEALAGEAFGPPLHLLVLPGELHALEREALVELAGLPETAGGQA
jgi:diphthine synthase